jgi:hypothetical protein
MGISTSERNAPRAPKRLAGWRFAAAALAAALTIALAGVAAHAAPDTDLSPFPDARPASYLFQDRTAESQPATATAPSTLPATDAPLPVLTRPSTAPFLASPPEHREADNNPGDVVRSDIGEIVPAEPARGPLTFSFTGLYMYGPTKGIAQTPRGGELHSSSINRPSFNAIGVDSSHIADGEFAIGLTPKQQIFFGGQYIHMSGNGVLNRSLVSDNVNFPARTHVHSDIRLDWYRIGYRYTFVLDTASNSVPDLTVTPFVDGIYWDYGFSMNGGRIGTSHRTLTKFGIQVGTTVAWRPNGGPLSIELSAAGFPQVARLANISVETLLARYRFYQFHNYDFNVLLGVAFEQQTLKDSKFPIANHVTAQFGPMLLTGLQVNF